jgi:hypothetical protein
MAIQQGMGGQYTFGGEQVKKDWNVGNQTGNFGDGSGLQGQNVQADMTGANARVQNQQQNNAINSEALARQLRNNTAQSNMQIAQAGLAGQGAGNAMSNAMSQQNSQMQLDAQMQGQAAMSQANMDAASMRQDAERHAQQQTRANQEAANRNIAQFHDLVARGMYDEAERFSRENNLGLHAGAQRFDRHIDFLDEELAKINVLIQNTNDPAEAQRLATQRNQLQWERDNAAKSRAMGHSWENVAANLGGTPQAEEAAKVLAQRDSFGEGQDPTDPPRQWTPQEAAAFNNINMRILQMQTIEGAGSMQTQIQQQMWGGLTPPATNANDFFNRASVQQIEQYGFYLGQVIQAFGAHPNQNAIDRLTRTFGNIGGEQPTLESVQQAHNTQRDTAINAAMQKAGLTRPSRNDFNHLPIAKSRTEYRRAMEEFNRQRQDIARKWDTDNPFDAEQALDKEMRNWEMANDGNVIMGNIRNQQQQKEAERAEIDNDPDNPNSPVGKATNNIAALGTLSNKPSTSDIRNFMANLHAIQDALGIPRTHGVSSGTNKPSTRREAAQRINAEVARLQNLSAQQIQELIAARG